MSERPTSSTEVRDGILQAIGVVLLVVLGIVLAGAVLYGLNVLWTAAVNA